MKRFLDENVAVNTKNHKEVNRATDYKIEKKDEDLAIPNLSNRAIKLIHVTMLHSFTCVKTGFSAISKVDLLINMLFKI